jgi:hypothetical protein
MSATYTLKPYFAKPPTPPGYDYAERIRQGTRAMRWAFEAAREGRLQARLERLCQRSIAAENVARDAFRDGKPEVAGIWRSLRDSYYKAHERAMASPRR